MMRHLFLIVLMLGLILGSFLIFARIAGMKHLFAFALPDGGLKPLTPGSPSPQHNQQ